MRETAAPWNAWLRERASEGALALGLGLGFAYMGPYRTSDQAFLARLGFWAGLLACWYVVASLVERALRRSPAYRGAGPWTRGVVLVACTSLPMILAVGPAAHALKGWEPSVTEVMELYLQTAVIGALLVLLSSAFTASAAAEQAPRPEVPAPTLAPARVAPPAQQFEGRLMARLAPPLRGRLLCLEMEDHYVRVHTDRGSALVLMRLGDAVAETAPVRGAQVHRSWWVANDAVDGFQRTGRTARLLLSNGVAVPVSQRHLRTASEMAARLAAD